MATVNPTLIATVVVGSGGASSINFTSIPQTYTDLKLVASIRTTRTGSTQDAVALSINSGSTSEILLQTDGSSASSNTQGGYFGYVDTSSNTANTFGNLEIYFPNYTNTTTYKSFSVDGVEENNATQSYIMLTSGLYSSTSAITSITINGSGGNYVQYSTAYLYGIKNS